MRVTTGCISLVKQLFHTSFECDVLKYSRKNEEGARKYLTKVIGEKVKKYCPFYRQRPFEASPYGLFNGVG